MPADPRPTNQCNRKKNSCLLTAWVANSWKRSGGMRTASSPWRSYVRFRRVQTWSVRQLRILLRHPRLLAAVPLKTGFARLALTVTSPPIMRGPVPCARTCEKPGVAPWGIALVGCSALDHKSAPRFVRCGLASCARAAIGHAAATSPSNVMNSRRFTRSPHRRGRAASAAR